MNGDTDNIPEEVNILLDNAAVAADKFISYDRDSVMNILRAVAAAAEEHSDRLAGLAAQETGFGVAEHKKIKNHAVVQGFLSEYGALDFCSHRVDREKKMVMIPRPAGVILGVTPSTGPTAAIFMKALSALLTRNAIVISPHPAAQEVGAEAVRILARAAERAGAPRNVIQILRKPTIPLVETVMRDPRVRLILATGGGGVVRAAYRSGTPAIGVGPGNPPCLVDETADLLKAANSIMKSKTFDASILCTAESIVFSVYSVADQLLDMLRNRGAYICSPDETEKIRKFVYPEGKFNAKVVGRPAPEIAMRAGFSVPNNTEVLVTEIDKIDKSEPLTQEKLSLVLAYYRVPDYKEGIRLCERLLRISGVGHTASIHTSKPERALEFSFAMPAYRVTVNSPTSLGAAGIGSFLPLTMSVGTGYLGGSSTAENLNPNHFVQWARMAYPSDNSEFPDFERFERDGAFGFGSDSILNIDKNTLKRIVLDELRNIIGAQ